MAEPMPEGRQIVAEFYKRSHGPLELFSLTTLTTKQSIDGKTNTSRTIYDINLSKEYGYIWHASGGGGGGKVEVSGIYFASAGLSIKEKPSTLVSRVARKRNKTRRLRSPPPSFALKDGHDLFDWLMWNAIEGNTVWCSTCDDCMPETDPCRHVWWCEKTTGWSTPSERCNCKDREECDA